MTISICPQCKKEIKQWNGGRASCSNCSWKGYYPDMISGADAVWWRIQNDNK